MTSAAISQMIRRHCKDAGLDRTVGSHAFRHFVVKKLLRAGRDPRIVRDYVGHTDVSVTMRYGSEVYDPELRNSTNELSLTRQGDVRLSRTG